MLELEAKLESIPALLRFVESACLDLGLDDSATYDLKLAVEEACTNVIVHGYGPDRTGTITVRVVDDDGQVVVVVRDEAPSFSPHQIPAPDLSTAVEEREPGGLGWHLIRQVIDETQYAQDESGANLLTLIKRRRRDDEAKKVTRAAAVAAPADRVTERRTHPAETRPGSLLVVDDELVNRMILTANLREQGHTVLEAANGLEALEQIPKSEFDLILLDILMPELDGIGVLEELKRHPTWRHIPVIVISSLDEMDTVVRCIEMGADDYLNKPFNPVLLRARIAACLEKKQLRDKEQLYARSMERELEIGREIQASFFPSTLPRAPGWDLATHFRAARQVAGDFYDAFVLPGGRGIAIVVADVCDKGVGAALFMGLFRSLLRAYADVQDHRQEASAPSTQQPGANALAVKRIVTRTNDFIALNHGDSNMFATLIFGVLESATGVLDYVNAGHEPALVLGPQGIRRLATTGPAVGMLPETPFGTARIVLEPGEALLAFTDGVTEARDAAGAFYGENRLLDLLARLGDPLPTAEEIVTCVANSLRTFTAGTDPSDDITLLALRRQPG